MKKEDLRKIRASFVAGIDVGEARFRDALPKLSERASRTAKAINAGNTREALAELSRLQRDITRLRRAVAFGDEMLADLQRTLNGSDRAEGRVTQ